MVKGKKAETPKTQATNGKPEQPEQTERQLKAAESLKGDIRDEFLTEIKQLKKPWEKLTEYEQERLIHRCRDIAGNLVRNAVEIAAARGFEHIPVSIGKFTVDAEKGIQSTFAMARSDENLLAMGRRIGSVVLLVPLDLHDFMGERKPAEPEVVGDLALPKTGPGAPSDPEAESKIGRGETEAAEAHP